MIDQDFVKECGTRGWGRGIGRCSGGGRAIARAIMHAVYPKSRAEKNRLH